MSRQFIRTVEKVPRFWDWFNTQAPMPADIQKAVKAAFVAHPRKLPLLRQAVDCPDCNAPLKWLPSHEGFCLEGSAVVQGLRPAARVLTFRVRLLAAEGNYDEALRTALTIFRLSRQGGRVNQNHMMSAAS